MPIFIPSSSRAQTQRAWWCFVPWPHPFWKGQRTRNARCSWLWLGLWLVMPSVRPTVPPSIGVPVLCDVCAVHVSLWGIRSDDDGDAWICHSSRHVATRSSQMTVGRLPASQLVRQFSVLSIYWWLFCTSICHDWTSRDLKHHDGYQTSGCS